MKIDPNRRYISVSKAIKLVFSYGLGVKTRPTITSWAQKNNLGVKVGGRWYIDEEKFISHLKGE